MAIPAFLAPIVTAIGAAWNRYQERKQAEHQTDMAIEQGKQRTIELQLANEHELNTTRLKSTGKWFKYFTFFMWFGPFMISWVFPEHGAQIFENLKILPDWYVQSCIAIMFTVWSISVSKETIQSIFHNLGKYLAGKRKVKLQRKVLFDIMRVAKQRPLSQAEVDMTDKAFDYIENGKDE